MRDIKTFTKIGLGSIRVVCNEGTWMFCASDLVKILGYASTNVTMVVNQYCKDVERLDGVSQRGYRPMIFISREDVLRILERSRSKRCPAFKKWLLSEIVPALSSLDIGSNDCVRNDVVESEVEVVMENKVEDKEDMMENGIQIFESEKFGKIRTMKENDNILFCASDVAKALGYDKPNNAISMHCRATLKRGIPISGKIQEVNFIPESDLYRLVFRSKLPDAEKFTDWVTEEVLPSIRKHGAYMTPQKVEEILLNPDTIIKLATALKAEQERNKVLTKRIAEKDQFISSMENAITVEELAKIFRKSGIDIGQRRLGKYLRQKKYFDSNNLPYQFYVDKGYFVIKESVVTTLDETKKLLQGYITPDGQKVLGEEIPKCFGRIKQ